MRILNRSENDYVELLRDFERNHKSITPLQLFEHRNYLSCYFELGRFVDYSFLVISQGHIVASVLLTFDRKEDFGFSYFNSGFNIILENKEGIEEQRIYDVIFKRIFKLAVDKKSVLVYHQNTGQGIDLFADKLIRKGGELKFKIVQKIDITLPVAALRRALRKSYKSLINRENDSVTYEIIDLENYSSSVFEDFMELHRIAAGSVTRSLETWNIQANMIRRGEAFMVCGFMDGVMVTGGIFPFTRSECYYGVSASNRELFHLPLSHNVLWNAIDFAKSMNIQELSLGEVTEAIINKDIIDSKLRDIIFFKRGFGGKLSVEKTVALSCNV